MNDNNKGCKNGQVMYSSMVTKLCNYEYRSNFR